MKQICPEHRWWECQHEELANPMLGKLMMAAGGAAIVIAILEITGVGR